ncbi:3-deoxy-7-phosphoheptulonate synthase [Chitinispirillales bacterium ANBcel5]|uniref:3-deoxy-7-phosphoheptulonate synthase n=1 Tax=Cellulosispirillum alkaliphilum TaxID=3039283 RepID=UPI002A53D664|nr:3-deoxy-7-phosphoheptulonate synthase [Chitinispirillales bacterium ANBcel5]
MGFTQIRKLPTPEEVKTSVAVPSELNEMKQQRDREIQAVLQKKEDRFIVVIGPCSAHDEAAVCDYVSRLAKLQQKVADKLILIPRIYTNKPRTTGQGYKGMAHQPNHLKSPNIAEGILAIRKMHIKALRESGLSAADEMLYPNNHPYLDDLLCYVAVGARSVENQQHRLTASGLDIPVGMKNPTSGDLKVALNSVLAAQIPHTFSYNGWEVATEGNPFSHLILRGSIDNYGRTMPNYHHEDLMLAASEYEKRGLRNPTIFVDTNHDNSAKSYKEQPRIAKEVLRSRKHSSALKDLIRGFMIESYIEDGAQKPQENVYGKSITDPCLGWSDSEKLIMMIAENC